MKINYISGCSGFQEFIRSAGYEPPEHIPTGQIVAFAGLNKPKGNKAARCLLFPDLHGGWLMDYSTGLFEVWQASRGRPYSRQEREAFRERCERDRRAREEAALKGRHDAAVRARTIWQRAIFADADNGYLQRKRVRPYGTKTGGVGGLRGVLIVPLYDRSYTLVNLQFIREDGTKRFLKGGQKKACFWWLGQSSPTVLVAEGFATAASLYEHTGNQCFIAFDAGNLGYVAKIVRAGHPDANLIIMGDNDSSGTGQRAARAAALAVGGKYLLPLTVGHDWNDAINAEVVL